MVVCVFPPAARCELHVALVMVVPSSLLCVAQLECCCCPGSLVLCGKKKVQFCSGVIGALSSVDWDCAVTSTCCPGRCGAGEAPAWSSAGPDGPFPSYSVSRSVILVLSPQQARPPPSPPPVRRGPPPAPALPLLVRPGPAPFPALQRPAPRGSCPSLGSPPGALSPLYNPPHKGDNLTAPPTGANPSPTSST